MSAMVVTRLVRLPRLHLLLLLFLLPISLWAVGDELILRDAQTGLGLEGPGADAGAG
jgi:hypothetical protein